ncbi:hypothetical protein N7501_009205 [Penicillium viridicatum]|nr:hypothetical protein N7501_009205 [Penicillium viridicatum]
MVPVAVNTLYVAISKVNGEAEGESSPVPLASVIPHIGNLTNHEYIHGFNPFETATGFEFEGDPGHGKIVTRHGLTAGLAIDQLAEKC